MDQKLFKKFRDIIYEKSGICLKEGKETLVSGRLAKRIRQLDIPDYKTYLDYLINDKSGNEIIHFLDVISTNVTSFFRDPNHFDFIAPRLREWAEAGQNRFRIWSAGCSSGEEPYSLAITFFENVSRASVDMKILATDLSSRILAKATNGTYESKKVETISKALIHRYFIRRKTPEGETFSVNSRLKDRIVFHRLNLSTPPFPMKGPLDVIFCRNVMIYFDDSVRSRLISEFHRLLRPDGFLVIGPSESITGIANNFRPLRPSIYMKAS